VEADAFVVGDALVVGFGDELQVGDPGRRHRWRLGCLGSGLGVGVAGDQVRHRGSVGAAAVADVDLFEVERGEHQLDLASGQRRLDLVGVAVQ